MVALALPMISDDQNLNADISMKDLQFEQHTKNQQWNLLSKSLEFYFLWLLSMMVIYALTFAVLLYIRSSKRSEEKAANGKGIENEQTSGNTVVSINDKDLYPILNLAGDQSSFYLKYLDVDKIPKSKNQNSDQTNSGEEAPTDRVEESP
ncbi:hypothetical protein ZYGR_0BA00500 [Zygosaccharomyces rouxii]|uniref:Uncharacterized protein n=1 Tax=Zygosaccharomyces rouxii TaxID=4956 RepID=A0A1Q3AKB6_ZYGRO|nr:hypothetical protein ZYGR_0BA00500 [Zygosaccharomyces rouxii]